MKMKTTALSLALLLLTSTAFADTRTGVAKRPNLQLWSFFHLGSAETKITVSWTKKSSNVVVILVCGSDPATFGIAAGGLDNYAEIVAGPTPNTSCLVGVGATSGPNTPFRIHFNQAVSEVSTGQGRTALEINAQHPDTYQLQLHAEHEFRRLMGR